MYRVDILSIQEVTRVTGVTSRTLRHYDQIGLLPPLEVGHGGVRYYGQSELVRLQRILLLRDLGLSLEAIRQVLESRVDEPSALRAHLHYLRAEQARLGKQIASVQKTITALEKEELMMAQDMFDGFNHTQYKDEVEQRWGKQAYADSDNWWRSMSAEEQAAFKKRVADLSGEWERAAADGEDPTGEHAQDLARRHVQWLSGVPGTPGAGANTPDKDYILGLADMYVADERFAANYGGITGAEFVRDTLREYVKNSL